MALELSSLVFKTETSDLERADKALEGVVTSMAKLDKAAQTSARTQATLAKAAKDSAKANLDNAKAQQVNAKSIEAIEQAQKKASVATEKSNSILQRQTDIYDFMTQGFSKGQASILASAKATGQLSQELKSVLDEMKAFETNPFDKSELGLKRLQKTMKEVVAAQGFFNEGSNLTTKQARELSNDLDRIAVSLTKQGKSYQDVIKAQALHKQEFIEEAAAVNRAQNALDVITKQRKEVATATSYLTQADQKLAAALNVSNASLDKAGTDSLVRYESALRKSGLAQDVVTSKLATYKVQLAQVQAQEMKRREQHLARAAAPQLTDIGVSLYSGQAPMTVLLQQSGQLVDLLNLSGVEAAKFGDILRTSFYSMVPAIKQVTLGIAGLVGGLFMDAGNAVTRFVGNITGISGAMEIAKRAIVSGGEENFKYVASLEKISKAAATTAAGGIAALIVVIALLALEYKKIIQAESDLSKALATSGGALGLTKDQAVAAAEGMSSLGVGTLKAMSAFTEIAKAGNIGKDSLELVTKAAIDLEKTAGVSIEETAKQYAKLQEDPAKALIEIAQKTGLVDKETLAYVASLERQGEKTEAARVATLALSSAHVQVASEIRDNWSPIEVLWNDIKSAIEGVKQEIYDLATSNAAVGAMRTVWETISVVISEVWFTIKGVGKEIGGIAAQIAAVMSGPGGFARAASIGEQMKADAESAADAQRKFVASVLNRSAVEQKSFNQSKEQNSQYAKWLKENDQALDKSISKEEKYKNKQLEMQKAVLSGTVSQIEADKALAGWKKIIYGDSKPKKDPSENYYMTLMREATNNTLAADNATEKLTKSELKLLEVKADPRFEKLNVLQKAEVISKYESAIASEKQAASTKKLSEAEEFRLKLLGESDGFGKQYYADMLKLAEYAKVAGWSAQEVEALTEAIYKSTPAWKAHEKALEAVNTAAIKFREDSIATQASITKENESLDYRISLLGKTTEEQRVLAIESTRANKLREVDVKLAKELREIEEKIAKAKKEGLPDSEYKSLTDAMVQTEEDAAAQRKVINREVAVSYAEDLDKEIRAVREGITDSIVTALFEGGKAGSKKLRDVLESTLRKKVTIVVDAVVNTLAGNVVGSLLGGSSGSSGSSLLSTASNLSSLTNLGMGYGIGNTAGTLLANATGTGIDGLLASNGAFGTAGGVLGAIGTALPWLAGGAAILSIGSSLFGGGGGPKTEASYGLGMSNNSATGGAGIYSAGVQAAWTTLSKQLGITGTLNVGSMYSMDPQGDDLTDFNAVATLNGKTISDRFARMGGRDAAKAGRSTEELQAAMTDETTRILFEALKASDLPADYKNYLSTVGNSIADITAAISNVSTMHDFATALTALPFSNLKTLSFEAAKALTDAAGGLDKFNSSLNNYYSLFYSESERASISAISIAKALSAVNVAMPTSKDAFRKIVDGLDLTTEAGRNAYTVLLSVASEFSSVSDAVKSLTDSLTSEAKRIRGLIAGDTTDSFATAQTNFAVNTAKARAGDETALSLLPELSQTLLSLAETNAATSVDLKRIQAMTASSLETTAAEIASKYGMKLPSYDVGTNYVPKNMIAQIHEGEAIIPKAYNPAASAGVNASSNPELLNTMQAILMKLDKLDQLERVDDGVRAIAESAVKTGKLLQRVTRDGEAMQTVAA